MFVLLSRGDRYDGNQPLHSAVITISSTYVNMYRRCGWMEPAAVLLDSRSGWSNIVERRFWSILNAFWCRFRTAYFKHSILQVQRQKYSEKGHYDQEIVVE